jgi:hypothetical protein
MDAILIFPDVLPLKEYCALKEKDVKINTTMKNADLKVGAL